MSVRASIDRRGESGAEALVALAYKRLLQTADRIDRQSADPLSGLSSRLVPGAWSMLKLAALGLAAPALAVWIGSTAIRNNRSARVFTETFPAMIDDVLAGHAVSALPARVGRIDASLPWFISSDLHRGPEGARDWPRRQNAHRLYEVALDWYADREIGLVENGDVEDFWMVGGSAYGVAWDIGRIVAGALPGAIGETFRDTVYREHFARIVANNARTYSQVRERFHRPGRYERIVGNHDDCFEDDRRADLLREQYPGLDPVDYLVLDGPDGPVGIIAHGHQTDGWNSPYFTNSIARFTTALGCAIQDSLVGGDPGLAHPDATRDLLEGRTANHLIELHPILGATAALDSLDERLLFEAARAHWGAGGVDLDEGPYFLFGHTHLPVSSPTGPDGGCWKRYLNSGSTVLHELVTGIEWNPSDTERPARLVAWTYRDDAPQSTIVATDAGRPVVRFELTPLAGGETLNPMILEV